MAVTPNLSGIARVAYGVVGVGLITWGILSAQTAWVRALVPVLGAIALVEGLIGF